MPVDTESFQSLPQEKETQRDVCRTGTAPVIWSSIHFSLFSWKYEWTDQFLPNQGQFLPSQEGAFIQNPYKTF